MNLKEMKATINYHNGHHVSNCGELPCISAFSFREGYSANEQKTSKLIKALKRAMEERILNHPNVEAGAMEDLEVELEAYHQDSDHKERTSEKQ